MSPASWSIATRITRWGLMITLGCVISLGTVAFIFLYLEARTEIDELASEELSELRTAFLATEGTPEDFAATCQVLGQHHPHDPMAWRAWQRRDGSLWTTAGDQDLVRQLPDSPLAEQALAGLDDAYRWRTAAIGPDLTVGLLLDGRHQMMSAQGFLLAAVPLLLVSAGASWLATRLLGQRISRLLAEVSASAQKAALDSSPAPHAREDLPSELQAVSLALRDALQRIQRESEGARLMASGLAHELRSPLQNLLMQAEVALMKERSAPEYRAHIAGQFDELQELIRAVDNLVTLCASPRMRRSSRTEAFDLALESRLRLEPMRERARHAGVALRLDVPHSLPFTGDREGVTLALRNLLANAIDWSPAGGRVELRMAVEGEQVEVRVEDQGPGVALDERERVFEPFYRSPAPRQGRVGYGLGLALVATVCESHAGSVTIGTSPLGGALFCLRLPIRSARPAPLLPADEAEAVSAGSDAAR